MVFKPYFENFIRIAQKKNNKFFFLYIFFENFSLKIIPHYSMIRLFLSSPFDIFWCIILKIVCPRIDDPLRAIFIFVSFLFKYKIHFVVYK